MIDTPSEGDGAVDVLEADEAASAEAVNPDVLKAPAGDDEEGKLFTCEHCGQTSLNGKCMCKKAKLARARQDVGEIIAGFPMWKDEVEANGGDISCIEDPLFDILVQNGESLCRRIGQASQYKDAKGRVFVLTLDSGTLNAVMDPKGKIKVSGPVEIEDEM